MKTDNMPLLSVIVPIYNTESYLPRCIDSIMAQTYDHIQIVLVDDHSTDASAEICRQYSEKHSNIKSVFKQENEGPAYARRDGAIASDGEYVGFVDSDDWIEPEMYASMMRYIIEAGSEIVSAGAKLENSNGFTEVRLDRADKGIYTGERLQWLKDHLIYCDRYHSCLCEPSLCSKVYKKDLFLSAMKDIPSHMLYWEDLSYVYPPILEAGSVAVIDGCFYHIVCREGSTSRTLKDNMLSGYINSLNIAADVYRKYGDRILQSFYKKARQIISWYMWSLPDFYDKNTTINMWREVRKTEAVRDFDEKSGDVCVDRLFNLVMSNRIHLAWLWYKIVCVKNRMDKLF